jgi:hypothetical protein
VFFAKFVAHDVQDGHRPIGTGGIVDVQDFQMSKLKFYMKEGNISDLICKSIRPALLEPMP